MVDWLPWHHTAGGNHNIGLVLYNGGTLYIDDGRPTAAEIGATVRNLREIAPTFYVNVPKGFEVLLPHLEDDAALRERFFSRLKLMFYAGAHLAQHVWEALQRHALETTGERILMLTGLGATETAPFVFMPGKEVSRAGEVGLPAPGIELKLVPLDRRRFDVRLKGPNITPGYWRQPELTAEAFDEEGFYRLGDALRFVDPAAPAKGFVFDGRIAEDFKLSTGTWVHVGELRRTVIAHFAPLLRDAVIAGHDRDEVTVLLVPDLEACRRLCGDAAAADHARAALGIAAPPPPGAPRRPRQASHRQLEPRGARPAPRGAALARRQRGDRQGLDQPARGAYPTAPTWSRSSTPNPTRRGSSSRRRRLSAPALSRPTYHSHAMRTPSYRRMDGSGETVEHRDLLTQGASDTIYPTLGGSCLFIGSSASRGPAQPKQPAAGSSAEQTSAFVT